MVGDHRSLFVFVVLPPLHPLSVRYSAVKAIKNEQPEKKRFGSSLLDPSELTRGRTQSVSSVPSGESGSYRSYDNFDTVDWVKDLNADSNRRHRMKQKAQASLLTTL